jgi:hypothetical protein
VENERDGRCGTRSGRGAFVPYLLIWPDLGMAISKCNVGSEMKKLENSPVWQEKSKVRPQRKSFGKVFH